MKPADESMSLTFAKPVVYVIKITERQRALFIDALNLEKLHTRLNHQFIEDVRDVLIAMPSQDIGKYDNIDFTDLPGA